jgi:dTDP-4-dehydrorhamnose reductase
MNKIDKIIILGINGMLGHKVFNIISDNTDIKFVGVMSSDFDLSTPEGLNAFSSRHHSDDKTLVINCVGLLRQRMPTVLTAYDYYKAFMLNSYLPHFLSERYKLIHITTDCVYSGQGISWDHGYLESDEHTEMDLYGKTKSLGEPKNALCLRTSIVGPEISGRNLSLFEWFMYQHKPINGFTNHFWNGLTTEILANCILKIIQDDLYITGVRHLFSNTVSKYELLQLFNKNRQNPIEINPVEAPMAIDRTLSTIYPEFLKQFNIPSIEEQIRQI